MSKKINLAYTLDEGALLEIKLSNIKDQELTDKITFKIDTGADQTTIHRKTLEDLKLGVIQDPNLKVFVSGSSEPQEGWDYSSLLLEIPQLKIKEELLVLVSPTHDDLHLLGRDILIKCNALFYGNKKLCALEI